MHFDWNVFVFVLNALSGVARHLLVVPHSLQLPRVTEPVGGDHISIVHCRHHWLSLEVELLGVERLNPQFFCQDAHVNVVEAEPLDEVRPVIEVYGKVISFQRMHIQSLDRW